MNQITNVKVVLLGDSGVGKSSILLRFTSDEFNQQINTTIGALFQSRFCEDQSLKFNVWDTAGQERFHSLAQMYFREADAVILVYDITMRKSFENLDKWKMELDQKGPKKRILVVTGNKEDLIQYEEIPIEEAKQYAESINAVYLRTSAKYNHGIDRMFQLIGSMIQPQINPRTTFVIQQQEKSRRKCC